jgi:hypothetical protein
MTHLSPKSPLSGRHPNPDVQDWDVMFRAVQARLRTAIDSLMSTSPLQLALDECHEALDALEQLRVTALRDW